jgi:hypothetical protein
MTPLALTAITNFILASEVFFLAGMLCKTGKQHYSALWFWALFMFLLGASALSGGIDHGFIEPLAAAMPFDFYLITDCVLGLMTAALLLTVTQQYIAPKLRIYFYIIAALQLAVFLFLAFTSGSYLVVIFNYLPVVLLLLVFSLLAMRQNRWAWAMVTGIVLSLIASAAQAMHVNMFLPLDYNGLYHVIMLAAVILLYLGGRSLKSTV